VRSSLGILASEASVTDSALRCESVANDCGVASAGHGNVVSKVARWKLGDTEKREKQDLNSRRRLAQGAHPLGTWKQGFDGDTQEVCKKAAVAWMLLHTQAAASQEL